MSVVNAILYTKIAEQVVTEGLRAHSIFGDQLEIGNLGWFAVLGEEFGEVASHVTKTCIPPITHPELTDDMLRAELIEVAAVALRWVYALDNQP